MSPQKQRQTQHLRGSSLATLIFLIGISMLICMFLSMLKPSFDTEYLAYAEPASDSESSAAGNLTQEELENPNTPTVNPFSEHLSDEEISADLQKASRRSYFTYRYEVIRDGKAYKLGRSPVFIFKPNDELRFYLAITPDGQYNNIKFNLGFAGVAHHEKLGADGISRLSNLFYSSKEPLYRVPLETQVYLNGQAWERYNHNGMWTDEKEEGDPAFALNLKKDFQWPGQINNRQYIEYRVKIPNGIGAVSKDLYMSASSGGSLSAGVATFFFNGYRQAFAEFNYVDDLAYRELQGLKLTAGPTTQEALALPSRAQGKPSFDPSPFKPLELAKLTKADESSPKISAPFSLLAAAGYESVYPLFNQKDRSQDFASDNFYNWMMPESPYYILDEQLAQKRPSFEDIKKELPGYVYISHDIDQPDPATQFKNYYPGMPSEFDNSRLNMAFDPDKEIPSYERLPQDRAATPAELKADLLDTKYYYLTYRALPQPLHINKTDDKGAPLAKAKFDLYVKLSDKEGKEREEGTEGADAKDSEKLLLSGLVSDEQGSVGAPGQTYTQEELAQFVSSNNPAAYHGSAAVYLKTLSNNKQEILLSPGTYILRESEAPEGYKKASEQIIEVKLQDKERIEPLEITIINNPDKTPPTPPDPFEPPSPDKPDPDKPEVPQPPSPDVPVTPGLPVLPEKPESPSPQNPAMPNLPDPNRPDRAVKLRLPKTGESSFAANTASLIGAASIVLIASGTVLYRRKRRG